MRRVDESGNDEHVRGPQDAALTVIFLAFILLFSVVQAFVLERRTHYG